MKQVFAPWMALLSSALLVQHTVAKAPVCSEVTFNVSGTAMNRNISLLTDLTNLTALTTALTSDVFGLFEIAGPQQIAGWYCEPNVTNANNGKLQFFMGSIATNRESWTAQGGTLLNNPPLPPFKPEIYSWVDYANNQGYATLALDHLGDGLSSHPDPILVVQAPYEVALYHDLAQQIKAGTTGQLPIAYSHLIYIGNSYGSVLGNELAETHPDDFESMVLTGFSKSVLPSLPGVTAQLPLPGALVMPARFGNLSLGYVTSPFELTRTQSFFGNHTFVDFEQEQSHLFWTREDVVSLGQFLSTYLGIVTAPAYTGRVLVLTGENDQAFCGPGSSAVAPDTMCGSLLADTASLFPNADYSYQNVSRSGHALILHSSAQTTLRIAHEFLAGSSFANDAPQ